MDIQEQIAVMQHFAAGGAVESTVIRGNTGTWYECDTPNWNWAVCEYRIKREPRKFVCWLNKETNEMFKSTKYNDYSCGEQPELYEIITVVEQL